MNGGPPVPNPVRVRPTGWVGTMDRYRRDDRPRDRTGTYHLPQVGTRQVGTGRNGPRGPKLFSLRQFVHSVTT